MFIPLLPRSSPCRPLLVAPVGLVILFFLIRYAIRLRRRIVESRQASKREQDRKDKEARKGNKELKKGSSKADGMGENRRPSVGSSSSSHSSSQTGIFFSQ